MKNILGPNFVVQEFVSKDTFSKFGDRSLLFVDENVIEGIKLIRTLIKKPIIINNWHNKGAFQYRGYRTPQENAILVYQKPVGQAPMSLHVQGRAIDFHVPGMSSEEVRGFIRKNWVTIGNFFTRMEDKTSGWVHLDRGTVDSDKIVIFDPPR